MTTETIHAKLPNRMVARQMVPGGCTCGEDWPCPQAAATTRWAALRDRLEYREEASRNAGRTDEASWCQSVLRLMDGMAAEPPVPAQQEER